MTPHRPTAFRTLLCALALLPGSLRAQTTEPGAEAPWLQIEAVVFRQLDTALAADERWPEQPVLGYPPGLHFLIEPGTPSHAAALAEQEIAAALAAEDTSLAPANPAATSVAAAELPRLRLAGANTLLADAAARIARSAQYRLIAHYAWRQPAPDAAHPEHVLLAGGVAAGEHFEQEGYLTLSRSRFWHVETRLWLNDFPEPGRVSTSAPAVTLPEVPKPPSLLSSASDILDQSVEVDAFTSAGDADSGTPPAAAGAITIEPPRPLRTVVLQAAQRVNPGELHYIDHPLFGVLLTIRPYDPLAPASADPASVPAQHLRGTPAPAVPPRAQ
jgi:hypothetical protein